LPWVSESAAAELMIDPKLQTATTNAVAAIRLRTKIRIQEIFTVSSFAVML
jgi:hypothetical protein